MIEEPCIIQMNIDRYRALLRDSPTVAQRARIEGLIAEANVQLTEAIARLERAITVSPWDHAMLRS